MAGGYYKPLTSALKAAGWEYLRAGKGDHEFWWNPKTGEKVMFQHNLKSRHTANGAAKDAGLGKLF